MRPTRDEQEAILGRKRPPRIVIDEAIRQAMRSPCVKSKRGVVLYNPEVADRWATNCALDLGDIAAFVTGRGHNGPPTGFPCTGDPVCRSACPKICVHAEERAIREGGMLDDVHDLELVHVKAGEGGVLVASPFGPGHACITCSRTVLDVGLRGVWLYEEIVDPILPARQEQWRYYTAAEFHVASLRHCGLPARFDTCRRYLGDNDATSPTLHCIRPAGHAGDCDNVRP